jgi:hypothetical protein
MVTKTMPETTPSIPEQNRCTMAQDSPGSEQLSPPDNEIDEICQRIMGELETASSQDLSEATYAKKIL